MRPIVAMLAATLLLAAGSASAQKVGGGASGLKGTLVSRTVLASVGTVVPVYVTAVKGQFVLTQFCWADEDAGDETLLSGSVLGLVATQRQNCRSYDPGLVFGPSETLNCVNTATGNDLVCTITGVQTPR
jgi:hypothetical protein